jgi:molybdate transport system ATP-binding protein
MIWDVAIRKTVGAGAQRFELDVEFRSDAQRLVLFGPSGAGKSLTLQAIAGLLAPDAGHVRIGDAVLFDSALGIDLPAERRSLGYVFQEYALFPHLTVRQNVAFATTKGWRNPSRAVADDAVDRWLDTLELTAFADRFADQLSGGQRQRLALARALVTAPRALLLDEPFAALDAPLRRKLRAELFAMQSRFAVPTLLITHDEDDIAAFATEVVPIAAGRAVRRPIDPDPQGNRMKTSARNHFEGTISRLTSGAVNDEIELTLPAGQRIVAVVTHESTARLGLAVGAKAFALVKASSVIVVGDLGGARLSARNQLAGTISRVQPGAVNAEIAIDVGGGLTIAAIVTQESAKSLGLAPGAAATAIFKASSVIVGVPG